MFDESYKGAFGGAEFSCFQLIKELEKDHQISVIIDAPVPFKEKQISSCVKLYNHPVLKYKKPSRYHGFKNSFPFYYFNPPHNETFFGAFKRSYSLLRKFRSKKTAKEKLRVPLKVRARLLDKINADLYITFMATDHNLSFLEYSKMRGGKGILFVTSDSELCLESEPNEKHILYNHPNEASQKCFTAANLVIAQNYKQECYLKKYDIPHALIKNIIPSFQDQLPYNDRDYILWVGRFSSGGVKQPELFLKLAQQCPQENFVMIYNGPVQGKFEQSCKKVPNINIIHSVASSKILDYFQKAKYFVSTSKFEGFPNTFLQAFSCGTPVLSLNVDPDLVLSQQKLGKVYRGDLDEIIKDLEEDFLVDDWQEMSENATNYLKNNHDPSLLTAKLMNKVQKLKL
ncbi:MAG: glycosyltransferase [Lentisphaeria bacterium]|nr:glycosyltransferase [Lentisphaeria bacterium]